MPNRDCEVCRTLFDTTASQLTITAGANVTVNVKSNLPVCVCAEDCGHWQCWKKMALATTFNWIYGE